jgi:N6-adenosine-specific RNA methylase IME4
VKNEIEKYQKPEIIFPNCKIKKTGLIFSSNIPFNEWEMIGESLRQIEGSAMWWIGDWCNFGEKKYGEKYSQALEGSDYAYQTLQNAAWVTSQIEFSRRRENLSFSFHAEVASLESKEQDKWLEKADKENLTIKELRQAIREERIKKETPALPTGKYRIIYADPPWQYADKLIEGYGAAEHHYPTMSIEELCNMPMPETEKDAVLFLWVTSPILEESFEIIEAWGFEYKASFIWNKEKHNYGHYNSVRHEFLLICTRGSCLPEVPKLYDSVITLERTERHSTKPEKFREIIDELYPSGKRIELFARTKAENWEAWGNE